VETGAADDGQMAMEAVEVAGADVVDELARGADHAKNFEVDVGFRNC
jgi:hypothetical protein